MRSLRASLQPRYYTPGTSRGAFSQKRQGASLLRTCDLTIMRHSLREPLIDGLSLVVICLLPFRLFGDVKTPGKTFNRAMQTSTLISR